MPKPFDTLPQSDLSKVTDFLFDIDDTVTLDGVLPREAANALYDAAQCGVRLYAVTGRSASWAELRLRLFPLAGAVAETGAMAFIKGKPVRVLHSENDADLRLRNAQKRKALERDICSQIPGARMALDNMGRVYDSAFDLIEDGPLLSETSAKQIRDRLASEGLQVAQSSVHINAWFGNFNKATMSDRLLHEVRGSGLEDNDTLLYAGDSKNDAAMFKRVHHSVGVANVASSLEALEAIKSAPRYVTEGKGGFGFAQIIGALVKAKS